ncbi:DUF1552 domain-containing protein [Lentisphaera profundi]|uniref:DUF1552 domain-containing protein n=1 Tax=Lentisphaera profundi TaxID=1658616 RepID=A0ABY7VW11_9BACT|nr:DUF1552 domain-containing protein [Lentisphaera profundi]WDE98421.1 DUF1552 domain-containing protein [Lentisphaera profundi]
MKRRDLIKMAALAPFIHSNTLQAKVKDTIRVKLKKNIVLVNLDLGLYAPHFRDGGSSCKYITEIFSEFKDQMTYFDGISEPGMGGGHECQPASFTALKYEDREHHPDRVMMSLDQRLAEGSIQESRHKFIYHRVNNGSSMSWNKFEQPLPAVQGANALYEQLFARTDSKTDKARIERERDILAALARNFRRYWTGTVQEQDMKASLEHQIAILSEREKWLKVKKPYMKKTFGENDEKNPLPSCSNNYELVYQALEKQQTKIAFMQFGGSGLQRGMNGIDLGHHGNTHHAGYAERIRALELIDGKVLGELKRFLHRLKEGNLYDDTIVLFHCGMGDAGAHDPRRTASFLFGGGFQHKESVACLRAKNDHIYSTCNLFSSVLKQSGFNDIAFNSSKTVIPELFKA